MSQSLLSVRGLHLESLYRPRSQGRVGFTVLKSNGVFMADERLGVDLERFTNQLGDAAIC